MSAATAAVPAADVTPSVEEVQVELAMPQDATDGGVVSFFQLASPAASARRLSATDGPGLAAIDGDAPTSMTAVEVAEVNHALGALPHSPLTAAQDPSRGGSQDPYDFGDLRDRRVARRSSAGTKHARMASQPFTMGEERTFDDDDARELLDDDAYSVWSSENGAQEQKEEEDLAGPCLDDLIAAHPHAPRLPYLTERIRIACDERGAREEEEVSADPAGGLMRRLSRNLSRSTSFSSGGKSPAHSQHLFRRVRRRQRSPRRAFPERDESKRRKRGVIKPGTVRSPAHARPIVRPPRSLRLAAGGGEAAGAEAALRSPSTLTRIFSSVGGDDAQRRESRASGTYSIPEFAVSESFFGSEGRPSTPEPRSSIERGLEGRADVTKVRQSSIGYYRKLVAAMEQRSRTGHLVAQAENHLKSLQKVTRANPMATGTIQEVSDLLNELGLMYHRLGRMKTAISRFEGALFIRRQELGLHSMVADTLYNIGACHLALKKYTKGAGYFEASKLMYGRCEGDGSPNYVDASRQEDLARGLMRNKMRGVLAFFGGASRAAPAPRTNTPDTRSGTPDTRSASPEAKDQADGADGSPVKPPPLVTSL